MFPFTLQQLRIVKALATEKSFTKAAELVSLSQPSLSKQLTTLEKNLNLVLLHRTSYPLSFTESGTVVLEYAERILGLAEECCRVLRDLKQGERGTVRIATTPFLHVYVLPKVLSFMTQHYPKIDFAVQTASLSKIPPLVTKNKVDFGLVTGEKYHEFQTTLRVEPWIEDEIFFTVPPFSSFPSNAIISKENFYQFHWITLKSNTDFQKFMIHGFHQNQIKLHSLKIVFQLQSMEALKIAVRLGLGAALVSSSTVETELKDKTLKVLNLPSLKWSRSFLWLTKTQSFQMEACRIFYREMNQFQTSLKE